MNLGPMDEKKVRKHLFLVEVEADSTDSAKAIMREVQGEFDDWISEITLIDGVDQIKL